MALTNCLECRKVISTQAKTCPHCGASASTSTFSLSSDPAQRRVQEAYLRGNSKKPKVIYGEKQITVYWLLALFFGLTGAHNFYARRYVYAIIQLGLLTLAWTILIPIAVFVWNVIEICSVRADGDGRAFQ